MTPRHIARLFDAIKPRPVWIQATHLNPHSVVGHRVDIVVRWLFAEQCWIHTQATTERRAAALALKAVDSIRPGIRFQAENWRSTTSAASIPCDNESEWP